MIEQGTAEWKAQRCGKATASRIVDILAKGKGDKPSRSRANYEAQLICERLTGVMEEGFKSAAMERGNEVEPEARDAYAFMYGAEVTLAEFVEHPRIPMAGASPDSYVGADGLLEIKCPNTATHLDTVLGAKIDRDYMLQMQFQMACTGRQWVDFLSYDPRLPADLQMFVRRIKRDDVLIAEVEAAVTAFLSDLDAKLVRIKALSVKDLAA